MNADPFSEILRLTQAETLVTGGFTASGAWAIRFPVPKTIKFFAVVKGHCWVTLDGESLTEDELREALGASDGLVRLKGKWVEIDREKLDEALQHWKTVARHARHGEITFFEGMRLLSGAALPGDACQHGNPQRER